MKLRLTIVAIALIAFSAFLAYGIKTDCPNTADYVHCSKDEM